jgi:hypothetical protein
MLKCNTVTVKLEICFCFCKPAKFHFNGQALNGKTNGRVDWQTYKCTNRQTNIKMQTKRQKDGQTLKQRDNQTERRTDRHKDRETIKQKDVQTDIKTNRQSNRKTDRHSFALLSPIFFIAENG